MSNLPILQRDEVPTRKASKFSVKSILKKRQSNNEHDLQQLKSRDNSAISLHDDEDSAAEVTLVLLDEREGSSPWKQSSSSDLPRRSEDPLNLTCLDGSREQSRAHRTVTVLRIATITAIAIVLRVLPSPKPRTKLSLTTGATKLRCTTAQILGLPTVWLVRTLLAQGGLVRMDILLFCLFAGLRALVLEMATRNPTLITLRPCTRTATFPLLIIIKWVHRMPGRHRCLALLPCLALPSAGSIVVAAGVNSSSTPA
ncbi:hypothetical protein BDV98DRAFT_255605 [Pterulicium gracile]|uniref:Uncharacterized protein n=1 Tax=Pterulicium gracile TaxID=1884261 RepID=A0A5C3Q6T7_9AGAR|nr:hypothetical protein BDV98DRAFT_255605 [Pterula gracilis]